MEDIEPEDWERVIQVDINSTFYVTRFVIPHLKKSSSGVIINMSSVAGRFGFVLLKMVIETLTAYLIVHRAVSSLYIMKRGKNFMRSDADLIFD